MGSGGLLGSGPELGGGAVPWNSPKSSSAAVKQLHKTHSRQVSYRITLYSSLFPGFPLPQVVDRLLHVIKIKLEVITVINSWIKLLAEIIWNEAEDSTQSRNQPDIKCNVTRQLVTITQYGIAGVHQLGL